MVKYKAEAKGIRVLMSEESCTSKASFLDRDEMPVWSAENQEKREKPWFSGIKIRRSLYKDSHGTIIHADLNGAANIARKVFPDFEVSKNAFCKIQTVQPY